MGFTGYTGGRYVLNNGAAATIKMGPFVSSDDGVTPVTDLSIGTTDVRLSKNDGDFVDSAITSAVHDENGFYDIALAGADTNTQGNLIVAISMTGALPVWRMFEVKDNPA